MTTLDTRDRPATQIEIADVVERTARLVDEHYVFPDVAARLAALLRADVDRHRRAGSWPALAGTLTRALQSVNGDRHLGVRFHEQPLPEDSGDPLADDLPRMARESLGGIHRVERLRGNVGLVRIEPALFGPALAGEAMTAALRLVADADALILDLRETIGGDPEMEALVCGHLFDRPTHLYTMRQRHRPDRQFWSPAPSAGARFGGDRPLAVLTSATTFSGGESLAYALQQHGRATVVGERTGGGAHPRTGFPVHAHLHLSVPVASPVNPVSGTNWEGTGVVPDVEVPAAEALDAAAAVVADPAGGGRGRTVLSS
ncbi:N-terminal domain of Peptidase_S41 [Micromonospora citrea]|uniref:N-terminal domain of Peptidase_S41 n=1 Tax=Micromonospora citrea TaxID=47855 RepID=A0A1C6UI11_9ACTN|nr:S41 family peptidase [Micromonospora citrea]SCL53735.1 N-terminal domain of Peptidase_S41 [Micromonospora citrea]